ncbi:interleukin-1 receptor-associated kinase 1-binding protein 1 homolog [Genypterus blacodes]|uniref:interleukin-1 receptor-associated kinase 1-binding protein 1 homolog n=1 Tax=Genypterus blacodes TaxID=154954 RepID=UPI003F76DC35
MHRSSYHGSAQLACVASIVMLNPGRVYAARIPSAGPKSNTPDPELGLEAREASRQRPANRTREVQVTGTAEIWCRADRASVRVGVGNSKESVNDVSNSVSRRIEYILQTFRQHGVKDEDALVRRFLHREADLCHMNAEVTVTFSDFEKMEQVSIVLQEKLDKSVSVGPPLFYHSAACLAQLRQRACVSAVDNAQQKASEVSRLLGQSLGAPLLVREEETREWRNEDEEEEGRPHLPRTPTITVSSSVFISFGLRDKTSQKL